MGKLGDLWVRLGLKKDEYSKGMKEAGNEAEAFGGKMGRLSALAKTAWAAVAAAVVKFASDAIKMTQKWGDQWNQTMAGIKGAYSSFVRQLSSGEGWDNLFANMREAYRVSKEVAAALDEVFERKTSFSYQEAETEKQIAQLQLIARDSSKSEAERKKASEEIIRLTNQLGESKKKILEDEAAAQRRLFAQQTGMNDAQIDFLVKEYNQNREVINQSRNYLSERKRLETELAAASSSYGTGAMTSSAYDAIQQRRENAQKALADLEKNTSQYIKDVAQMTKLYDKGNDELVKGMAEAEVAVIRVDTETLHAQTRATALLGTLSKAGSSGGSTTVDPRIAAAARVQERLAEYGKSELQLLNEKYQQEKALLESLGIDTTTLAEEYSANIKKILDVPLSAAEKLDDLVVDLDFQIDDEDDPVKQVVQQWEKDVERLQNLIDEFKEVAVSGFSDAVQELANQFMGLSEINPGSVVSALLTPLADMAIKEGEILMAEGLGVEACKKALESLNGYAAIAAGAALIAIGSAAKAGLKSLASGASRSAASSTATSSTSGYSSGVEDRTEITIYVRGKLEGSDIVLSGEKTLNKWDR